MGPHWHAATLGLSMQLRVLLIVCLLLGHMTCAHGKSARLEFTEHNLQLVEAATPLSQKVSGSGFGDSIIFRNPLLDFKTQQKVGHTDGVCVYTVARDATGSYELECSLTFVLKDGTFTVTGQWLDVPSAMAVVGGTGMYSGATGVVQQSTLEHNDAPGTGLFALNVRIYTLPEIKLPALGPHKPRKEVSFAEYES